MLEQDSTITCPFCETEQYPYQAVLGSWGYTYACRCRFCGGAFTFGNSEEENDG